MLWPLLVKREKQGQRLLFVVEYGLTWNQISCQYAVKFVCVMILFVLVGGIAIIISLFNARITPAEVPVNLFVPPDPIEPQPPSWNKPKLYKRSAICTDGVPCASFGRSMLKKNGSAVDAAIATLICNGLVNMQSMGFGGGFLMTIYDHANRRAITLNARERAPKAALMTTYETLAAGASRYGPMAIAVPGELAGYQEAHNRFGRLPWAEIFAPSIALCESGFAITKVQYDTLQMNERAVRGDPSLSKWFVDENTDRLKMPGSIVRPQTLCETMRVIAKTHAAEFYNGSLGLTFIEDLRRRGSIMTQEDLATYRIEWQEPIFVKFSNGDTLYTVRPPGGGALLAFILNIIDGYKFDEMSIVTKNATLTTIHRIVEAYKYAHAFRAELADPEFVDLSDLLTNLTSRETSERVRQMISNHRTWNDPHHYGASSFEHSENHGTAHTSILAETGDAVSVTSSVNIYFGSGIVSERTGILSSSSMDDFSLSSGTNYFDLPASINNRVEPGKRPLSSMSPSIVVGDNGSIRMVIGAAGGTKIPTAIAYVITRHLWLNNTIKEAVDAPRIHHQLIPMQISYEYGLQKTLIDGLSSLGHKTFRYRDRGSVVCAIARINNTIYAIDDYRKGGDVHGLD